ncbi:MAG: N(G),N(G)-dimethylarginine dimethylaminohydrolase, partial [Candidatus Fischerbacteria bacterium RBG_13_37_8]
MITKAIVRTPGRSVVNGITFSRFGKPDYRKALEQHAAYVEALKSCGLEVIVMESDERYPDSTFVEDCAVLNEQCAIIANPGVKSRKGEIESIGRILGNYYAKIEYIREPGTLDGGDVMRVGNKFYIGISARTNSEGASQLIQILKKYKYTGLTVALKQMLHLKTGVAYLGNNTLLVAGELKEESSFSNYCRIPVEDDESYAANCIRINDYIIVPLGYEKTKRAIIEA